MKKAIALATTLVLTASILCAFPVSAAGIEDNLVTHWDFAGENPLADKATAGKVSDTLTLHGNDEAAVTIDNGKAVIPSAGAAYLYAAASQDLLASAEMKERTVFMAYSFDGTPSAFVELISQNGGGRIIIDHSDMQFKGSISAPDSIGTDVLWPVQQKVAANQTIWMAITMKLEDGKYTITSYLSTDEGATWTAKAPYTANAQKTWGTLVATKKQTALTLGKNITLVNALDPQANVELPAVGGGGGGVTLTIDDVRIYNKVLSEAEVKTIKVTNPTAPTPDVSEDSSSESTTNPGTSDALPIAAGFLAVVSVAVVLTVANKRRA